MRDRGHARRERARRKRARLGLALACLWLLGFEVLPDLHIARHASLGAHHHSHGAAHGHGHAHPASGAHGHYPHGHHDEAPHAHSSAHAHLDHAPAHAHHGPAQGRVDHASARGHVHHAPAHEHIAHAPSHVRGHPAQHPEPPARASADSEHASLPATTRAAPEGPDHAAGALEHRGLAVLFPDPATPAVSRAPVAELGLDLHVATSWCGAAALQARARAPPGGPCVNV